MKLQTKHFGEIEVVGDKVITFPHGIIAFEDKKRFVLIDSEDKKLPLSWLQSIDDPSLAFVVMNPFVFKKDYEFDIPQDAVAELAINKHNDVHILVILVIPEDITKMTANLLAPLVINIENRKGKQVILDDTRYATKHLIMEELRKSTRGGIKDAGSD
ncbi:MAG: flagellar assembly protein FliW [Bacillota bacterium]|uniref:Flagellar assembly factor FliW n=1 Tax=Thermanaerosceptrum fracticalcis TaxID=1712410 RepID=A0A7G6E4A6_THEFR|nr:flagellar assembly protein FliW [Thermanaerosceptrum fracticalcis]QNB46910.1 flagellar assembly protein FliW [Thermanaerosceptrum fracticalcis]